ncbi:MAG: tripartite tricarboxylate transporter TctB family protein [Betaproteobacteria bacterium]|nr:tripartite tricarboxylate transporter TctB family protein [Betaproteobacteria bacterium]
MRSLTVDQIAGTVFAAFSLLVLWESRKIPFGFLAEPGPGAVPAILAFILLACSIAVVIGGRFGRRMAELQWTEWRHAVVILGVCAFMALALERLGYRLTIFVALLVLVSVLEKKGWIAGVVFAGCFSFGTYYLFNALLHVPLPLGPFGL